MSGPVKNFNIGIFSAIINVMNVKSAHFPQPGFACCISKFFVTFQVEGWCPKKSWTKTSRHKFVEPEVYVSVAFPPLLRENRE